MAYYQKGANAERELIHELFNRGFSVVRVAGSGKTALPAPDLIALRKGKRLAFECKAWSAKNLSIPIEQMEELVSWCDRADVEPFIGWKFPREGWFFISPKHFHRTSKYFTLSKHEAEKHSLDLNVVAGVQAQLGTSAK